MIKQNEFTKKTKQDKLPRHVSINVKLQTDMNITNPDTINTIVDTGDDQSSGTGVSVIGFSLDVGKISVLSVFLVGIIGIVGIVIVVSI
ncbi:hypothetical protein DERP_005211 [Dermatophagoides pteronyssinus]|uniref:Uncharacterized protein n=1 Tax=Dermatophagoides pteronyssinus TaxID=6956 RepID=A0ABQ8JLX8_DERPT|nr:hypothetical protein DERP_005211 [Dermatophagoides pteronyssinus]